MLTPTGPFQSQILQAAVEAGQHLPRGPLRTDQFPRAAVRSVTTRVADNLLSRSAGGRGRAPADGSGEHPRGLLQLRVLPACSVGPDCSRTPPVCLWTLGHLPLCPCVCSVSHTLPFSDKDASHWTLGPARTQEDLIVAGA